MSAICIADLHLSHVVPVCRRETPEEWIQHQRGVLSFIANKCNDTCSGLYIAGDIFDKAIVSEEVVNMFLDFINSINGGVLLINGNHDMKNRSHSTEDTSFGIIERAYEYSNDVYVNNSGYGSKYTDTPVSQWEVNPCAIGTYMVHTLCYETEKECVFSGCSAQTLLDKFPNVHFLVVGDQHHGFCYENDSRFVINCGCILKRNVDFKDEMLRIWYINEGHVQAIDLPVDNGVHDEHRIEMKDRDGRVTLLLEKLSKSDKGISVDFVKNVIDGLTDCGLSEYTIKEIKKFVEVDV